MVMYVRVNPAVCACADKGHFVERVRNTLAASMGKLREGLAVVMACDINHCGIPGFWGRGMAGGWAKCGVGNQF